MQSQFSWKQKIDDCQRELQEYDHLDTKLRNLTLKTRHKAKVALGPLAHMHGSLRHTNELKVYLGDGVWVERSTHQAAGIIERRRKIIRDKIEKITALKAKVEAKAKIRAEVAKKETPKPFLIDEIEEQKLEQLNATCEVGSPEWWDRMCEYEQEYHVSQKHREKQAKQMFEEHEKREVAEYQGKEYIPQKKEAFDVNAVPVFDSASKAQEAPFIRRTRDTHGVLPPKVQKGATSKAGPSTKDVKKSSTKAAANIARGASNHPKHVAFKEPRGKDVSSKTNDINEHGPSSEEKRKPKRPAKKKKSKLHGFFQTDSESGKKKTGKDKKKVKLKPSNATMFSEKSLKGTIPERKPKQSVCIGFNEAIKEKNNEKLRPLLETKVPEKADRAFTPKVQKRAKSTEKASLFKQMISGESSVDDGLYEYDVEDAFEIPKREFPQIQFPPEYEPVGRSKRKKRNFRETQMITCKAPPQEPVRVLFLDVDGVLNNGNMWSISPPHLQLFRKIWEATKCYIVLSTAWRNGVRQRAELLSHLSSIGIHTDVIVLGDTPNLHGLSWVPADLAHLRVIEIKTWLAESGVDVYSWVAVDDMPLHRFETEFLNGHFVQTNCHEGLTEKKVDRILQLFNEGGTHI